MKHQDVNQSDVSGGELSAGCRGLSAGRKARVRAGVFGAACALAVGAACGVAQAQVRIAQWNITNYSSGRVSDLQQCFYGTFSGRSMSPDLIVVEEMLGASSVTNLLNILNGAPGSPGDWAAAPFVANGGDTDNAMFYRTSRFTYLGVVTLNAGTGVSGPPRDNQRWQVRLAGYSGAGAEFYIYAGHWKAQESGSGDDNRRLLEAQRIRDDAATLPAGAHYIFGGDTNEQSSTTAAYQAMVSAGAGQFLDPINTPGTWNNNGSFRFVHTQDPFGSGGMDDRHDQLLISATLRNQQGLDYMPGAPGGNIFAAYSTSTWNDSNHSYRAWGNDGTSFNLPLTTTGNTMVGPTIAQALINSTGGATGHLPVFLDLQVPAKVNAPAPIHFGVVSVGASSPQRTLTVTNSANVALYSKDGTGWGIDALTYTLSASAGFTAPGGTFNESASAGSNAHTLTMSTLTPGCKTGTVTINSDDPDTPARVVPVKGLVVTGFAPVVSAGDYDVNGDCQVNVEDLYVWYAGNTDVNLDGSVNATDGTYLKDGLRSNEVTDMTAGRR